MVIRRVLSVRGTSGSAAWSPSFASSSRGSQGTHRSNPIGGKELYDVEGFAKQGIKLRFINTGDIKYKQFGEVFIDKLSILDVIMFNSKDDIREMLGQYELIS